MQFFSMIGLISIVILLSACNSVSTQKEPTAVAPVATIPSDQFKQFTAAHY